MRVTERLASLFVQENLEDRSLLADQTNQFLQGQLEEAKRRLLEHEKKLQDFRQRNNGQLPDQITDQPVDDADDAGATAERHRTSQP